MGSAIPPAGFELLPYELQRLISLHPESYNLLVRCAKRFKQPIEYIEPYIVKRVVSRDHIAYRLPNGKLHSIGDAPSLTWLTKNTIEWHKYGKRNRPSGGYALLYNGTQHWYYNSTLHRGHDSDGNPQPATIYANGYKEYWLYGVAQIPIAKKGGGIVLVPYSALMK